MRKKKCNVKNSIADFSTAMLLEHKRLCLDNDTLREYLIQMNARIKLMILSAVNFVSNSKIQILYMYVVADGVGKSAHVIAPENFSMVLCRCALVGKCMYIDLGYEVKERHSSRQCFERLVEEGKLKR